MINHATGAAGVVSQQCKTVVNQYEQTISDLLLSETQLKKICSQMGMCTFDGKRGVSMGIESVVDKENAKLSNGVGDAACSACEMTVVRIQIQLRQNMTQERILDYFNDLCERLPSPMGESAVDCAELSTMPTVSLKIGGKVFDLALEETQLKKICSQIGMCTFDGKRGVSMGIESVVDKENAKSSNGVGDAACSACEMAVVWIQSQLRQNMTQERTLDYINDLCERLPSPMGGSAVDCAQLSTMPTVSLTIGGKVFDLASEEVGEGDTYAAIHPPVIYQYQRRSQKK